MPPRSIAVLPFDALGTDEDLTFLGDGIAGEILTALSKAQGLRVAARSSSFTLRSEDARTAGERLAVALAAAARETEARELVQRLEAEDRKSSVLAVRIALVYGWLGDLDAAFRWLETGLERRRDPWITHLRADPAFDPVRDDVRFDALAQRVGSRGGAPDDDCAQVLSDRRVRGRRQRRASAEGAAGPPTRAVFAPGANPTVPDRNGT